jgi:hypothetical protein
VKRFAGKTTSIVIAAVAVFWIVSTWVAVPGWSEPSHERFPHERFPHAVQIFWTAVGVFFLCLAVVAYRHKDDEDDS